ncbi:MAG: hypothetical protein Q8M09_14820 [Pseudomonadota bacterium]|nr:hypothetical protein [Pseudomonadota bacterium]
MLALKIIGVVSLVIGLAWSLIAFDARCYERYAYNFFTRKTLLKIAIAIVFLYGGYAWFNNAVANKNDTLNGLVLMAIGVVIVVILAYQNYKNTDWLHGTAGTALQLTVFGVLAVWAIQLLALVMVFALLAGPFYNGPRPSELYRSFFGE